MLLTFRSRGARADVGRIPGDRRSLVALGLPNRSSWLIALALAVVFGSLGGSASAAVTHLQRYHAESPSNSLDKAVPASCPAGKQVLGGGAELIGGESQVALNDVRPNGPLTSVTAVAHEDQTGYAGSWSLRAYALCATPPPGLKRIPATSPTNSTNKTVTVTCPAGKRLLGAGADISGGGREVVVQDIRVDSLTSVTAQGVEDQDGTASDWLVSAYAICSNPVHLLERVVATSPSNSLKAKSATATCPAGKRVVGGGGEVGGIGGQVVLGHIRPSDLLDSFTAHAAEDEDGTASNWTVRAFAICASVSKRVVATSPTDSSPSKELYAHCPSDMEATGGGGDITGGGGQVKIWNVVPHDAPTVGRAGGAEDGNGYAGAWFVRAYAICSTPLPGQEMIDSIGSLDSSSTKAVTATCPAGKRVVGAGGYVNPRRVVLDDVRPNAALTSVTATGYEEEIGDPLDWQVQAIAVCALAPPGLELISAASPVDSSNKRVNATCPSGKNLLGTGAEIDGGFGQVVLDHLTPDAGLRTANVTGLEDETGFAGAWSLRSYAICASP
jgi:hypothetical protein